MSYKVYGALLLLVAIALTIVVVQQESSKDESTDSVAGSVAPGSSPLEEAPSKENASEGVRNAIDHLKKVVEDDPDNANALFELARLLQDAHQPLDAIRNYETGLRLRPENTGARVDYSLCLFESGRVDEALTQNRIVLSYDRTNTKALYNIGAVYANRGVRDSAEAYWNRLIVLAPEDDLAGQARANITKLRGMSSGK
jgi:tetratricopeptide (TPR) repeat protein